MQTQSDETIRSGKLDRCFDAMDGVGAKWVWPFCDMYRFYVQRGITERAQRFRETARKTIPVEMRGDLESGFNDVDAKSR
jgi:hypothetical protein